MTQQAEQIRDQIASRYNIDPAKVTDEKSLVLDLQLDSLEHVEMCMDLEETFNIDIADNDAENLKTVADVIRLVAEMTAHA